MLFVSPEPGIFTTAQCSALINLQFRLLHTLFSYSSLSLTLAKEKHWQENSAKAPTENEMVIHLLCIFWQQSFFLIAIYAGQRKCVDNLPTRVSS